MFMTSTTPFTVVPCTETPDDHNAQFVCTHVSNATATREPATGQSPVFMQRQHVRGSGGRLGAAADDDDDEEEDEEEEEEDTKLDELLLFVGAAVAENTTLLPPHVQHRSSSRFR
jgi:hypothetical protein